MANTFNYAEKFLPFIQEKYSTELKSNFLVHTNPQVRFIDAKTIKVPSIALGGYGSHTRTIGFNSSDISNSFTPYVLAWDRDVEYFMDAMDVDETNIDVFFAGIHNQFEEQVAIPEKDSYRFSQLVAKATTAGSTIDTTALDATNVLAKFDSYMQGMDEAGVKEEGRKLVVTPAVYTLLKNAQGIQRTLEASNAKNINRLVHSLDDVEIIKVPSSRMKTAYADTGSGVNKRYAPASGAKQINMILVEPTAVICEDKYAYIKVFTPGSDSRVGDGYLYQNRCYGDLFVIPEKKDGVIANVEA